MLIRYVGGYIITREKQSLFSKYITVNKPLKTQLKHSLFLMRSVKTGILHSVKVNTDKINNNYKQLYIFAYKLHFKKVLTSFYIRDSYTYMRAIIYVCLKGWRI